MKKLKIISTALVALLCLFSLTSCFTLFTQTLTRRRAPTPEKLSAPKNLTVDEETKTLTWSAVENATAYNVSIDYGTIYVGDGTAYSLANLAEGKTYSITVKAIGDGIKFADSAYSSPAYYELYSEYENGARLSFALIDGGAAYSVAKGSAKSRNIIIPATYNNKPVTKIAERGFYGDSIARNIVIPDGITSIGDWAFFLCSALTSVEIPDSVTSIGDWAFGRCARLTSVEIPAAAVSMGYRAFEDCSALTSLTLNRPASSGVTMVYGGNVFYNCPLLENIYVPADSVTTYQISPAWSAYANLIKAIPATNLE